MALTDNLLAFYKLSDLTDSSGNNRTLTNNGNVSFASGKIGNAAVFDGANWLQAASTPSFNFGSGDFTINAWFYLTSDPSDFFIVSARNNNGLFLGSGYPQPGTKQIGWGRVEVAWDYYVAYELSLNQWYHIALTRNGTDMKMFVNGNQVGETITNSELYDLGLGDLSIGAQNSNYFLNGQIDAVGIWNRALSDAEVAALYNNGAGLEVEVPPPPYTIRIAGNAKFQGKVKFA